MRVVYVIDDVGPAGAERSLIAMTPGLCARGVDLEVVTLFERPGLHDELRAAGARLTSLAGPGGRAARVRRVHDLLGARRPDLVHTTLFEADLAGRTAAAWARLPVVSTLANTAYGPEQLASPQIRRARLRAAQALDVLTARFVDRFHAVSRSVADVMARRLLVPRDRIEVVHRGRDPAALGRRDPPRRKRARDALGVDGPLVVAVGRHEYQKGFDVLGDAIGRVRARVPGLRVVVAGRTGALTPRLEGSLRAAGFAPEQVLLGVRDDVADLLAAADVLVLPSRWEGFPGVVMEAMALEAPIVASDIGPVRELVDESTARLVPVGAPDALADAILATLADPEAPTRARRARARFLACWTADRAAERMVGLYESVLRRRRSARPRRGSWGTPRGS